MSNKTNVLKIGRIFNLTPRYTLIVFTFVLSKCFLLAWILILLEWVVFFFITRWEEPDIVSLNVIGHI